MSTSLVDTPSSSYLCSCYKYFNKNSERNGINDLYPKDAGAPQLPITSKNPNITKNTPPMIEMILKTPCIRAIYRDALPTLAAMIRKGTARPAENTASKNMPETTDTEVEASNKIVPKIGPTHGVQPSANAPPSINEFNSRPRSKKTGTRNRASRFKNGIFNTFIMKSPNIMTNNPPIRVSHIRKGASANPINPASAPNTIKTKENPTMK